MSIYEHTLYQQDLAAVAGLHYDWNRLKDASFLITGATGMIGSFLIDVLMKKNQEQQLNCTIFAVGRSEEKARKRFGDIFDSDQFHFLQLDINKPFTLDVESMDYVLHAASNTHPKAYATDPIGTITANVIATHQLLEQASQKQCKRFVFLSSVEIYGENRGDVDAFDENYLGYINCNTLRAGYPESKRVGEALCQAYISQKGMDIVIPRLSRVYGPTMLMSDSKALSQFIKKALNAEDIVLKSEGNQFYSYSYVADITSAIFKILFDGKNGEAYNVSNSDITLKALAGMIAESVGRKVVFELPDETERKGYSTATKAILDTTKVQKLGWEPLYTMEQGIRRTIEILKETE